MSPRSIVITGSNRGLGLGLVRKFLQDTNITHIIATSRDPEKSEDLHSITDPRLRVLQLDLSSDDSVQKFVQKVTEIVGEDYGLSLLINNAAIMKPYVTDQVADRSKIRELFETNTFGSVVLTQKLLPLLKKAAKTSDGAMSIDRSAVINIASEILGSISLNIDGSAAFDSMAYRMTKTAINQFTRTASIDLKPYSILVAGLCPGWINSDMGGANAKLTVDESAKQLVESFGKLNESHSGGYFRRDLSVIPF